MHDIVPMNIFLFLLKALQFLYFVFFVRIDQKLHFPTENTALKISPHMDICIELLCDSFDVVKRTFFSV